MFDVVGYEEHLKFKTLVCSICRLHLPEGKFGIDRTRRGRRWRAFVCKDCLTKRESKRRKDHPGKLEKTRRRVSLKRYFGLTLERYEEMRIAQNNQCAICGTTPQTYSLCVDHCHKTNKIRGLLCSPCNRAIGQLGDTVESLEKAYLYLKENS